MHDKFSCETTCINGRKSAKKERSVSYCRISYAKKSIFGNLIPWFENTQEKGEALSSHKIVFKWIDLFFQTVFTWHFVCVASVQFIGGKKSYILCVSKVYFQG